MQLHFYVLYSRYDDISRVGCIIIRCKSFTKVTRPQLLYGTFIILVCCLKPDVCSYNNGWVYLKTKVCWHEVYQCPLKVKDRQLLIKARQGLKGEGQLCPSTKGHNSFLQNYKSELKCKILIYDYETLTFFSINVCF